MSATGGPVSVRAGGVEEMRRLGQRLRGADRALRQEVYRALIRAADPVQETAAQEFAGVLPSGFRDQFVASLKVKARPVFGRDPRVEVTATALAPGLSSRARWRTARRASVRDTRARQRRWVREQARAARQASRGGRRGRQA